MEGANNDPGLSSTQASITVVAESNYSDGNSAYEVTKTVAGVNEGTDQLIGIQKASLELRETTRLVTLTQLNGLTINGGGGNDTANLSAIGTAITIIPYNIATDPNEFRVYPSQNFNSPQSDILENITDIVLPSNATHVFINNPPPELHASTNQRGQSNLKLTSPVAHD